MAEQVSKEIRGAKYLLVDSGHFFHLQTPQLFAETVLRFFKGN